jgi:hypothetical protein
VQANVWKKSSYSTCGSCVEVKASDDQVMIRDTKLRDASPVITITREHWNLFIDEIKRRGKVGSTGLTDMTTRSILDTLIVDDGTEMLLWSSVGDVSLHFTEAEWDAFVDGARDGEFDLV